MNALRAPSAAKSPRGYGIARILKRWAAAAASVCPKGHCLRRRPLVVKSRSFHSQGNRKVARAMGFACIATPKTNFHRGSRCRGPNRDGSKSRFHGSSPTLRVPWVGRRPYPSDNSRNLTVLNRLTQKDRSSVIKAPVLIFSGHDHPTSGEGARERTTAPGALDHDAGHVLFGRYRLR